MKSLFELRKKTVIFHVVTSTISILWMFFSLLEGEPLFFIFGIVAFCLCTLVYITLTLRYWRCPHCNCRYSIKWHPIIEMNMYCCPLCGERIK